MLIDAAPPHPLSYKRQIGYTARAICQMLFLIIAFLETIGSANFRSGVNRVKQVVPAIVLRAIS